MAWLQNAMQNLTLVLYNSTLAIAVAVLTTGLAWGIRPALMYPLMRMDHRQAQIIATLVQTLIIIGGMALIVAAVGINALLLVLTIGVTFLAGVFVGGETLLADRIAAMRIRRRTLYQVGDLVTLDNQHYGVVQKIDGTKTYVHGPDQAIIIVRNSRAIRKPIVLHAPATGTQTGEVPIHHSAVQLGSSAQDTAVAIGEADRPPALDADDAAITTTPSAAEQPGDQSTPLLPAVRRTILNHAAMPLTRRAVLGKRTVQKLR